MFEYSQGARVTVFIILILYQIFVKETDKVFNFCIFFKSGRDKPGWASTFISCAQETVGGLCPPLPLWPLGYGKPLSLQGLLFARFYDIFEFYFYWIKRHKCFFKQVHVPYGQFISNMGAVAVQWQNHVFSSNWHFNWLVKPIHSIPTITMLLCE